MVVAYLLAVQAEHHHYHWMAASSSPAVGFAQPELHQPLVAPFSPGVLVAAESVAGLATARMPVASVLVGVVVNQRIVRVVALSVSGLPEPP